jgi:hypothetical protein
MAKTKIPPAQQLSDLATSKRRQDLARLLEGPEEGRK